MATSDTATTSAGSPQPVTESQPRRTIAAYPSYAGAERAVDWLSRIRGSLSSTWRSSGRACARWKRSRAA